MRGNTTHFAHRRASRQADSPEARSFGALANRVGLAGSTIVQRVGSKVAVLQAELLHAWDRLDANTAAAINAASADAAGVVDMLVALTGQYETNDCADQLLVLREDLRDPVLRARGTLSISALADAIERRPNAPGDADGLGLLVVAHWQGTLTVWSFTRSGPLTTTVRDALDGLLRRLLVPSSDHSRRTRRTS